MTERGQGLRSTAKAVIEAWETFDERDERDPTAESDLRVAVTNLKAALERRNARRGRATDATDSGGR